MKDITAEDIASKFIKEVFWSDEDGCFIGSLPEICGPCCDNIDKIECKKELDEIAEEWAQIYLDDEFSQYTWPGLEGLKKKLKS